jgi:outer membrane protein assembly factor BamE (lipoprotein component of BamABCDE complex)
VGVGVGFAVLVLLLGLAWFFSARHGLTRARYERIEPGMTRAEVGNLLGQESGPLVSLGAGRREAWYVSNRGRSLGRQVVIQVAFDDDDRVIDKAIGEEQADAWASRVLRR